MSMIAANTSQPLQSEDHGEHPVPHMEDVQEHHARHDQIQPQQVGSFDAVPDAGSAQPGKNTIADETLSSDSQIRYRPMVSQIGRSRERSVGPEPRKVHHDRRRDPRQKDGNRYDVEIQLNAIRGAFAVSAFKGAHLTRNHPHRRSGMDRLQPRLSRTPWNVFSSLPALHTAGDPRSAVEPPISPPPRRPLRIPLHGVLDGIKYTEIERQGALTRQTCRRLGIPTVPIAYHGGVDTNADGVISENNIARFTEWVDRTIPRERTMPAVLDYEQPWWDELTAESIEPDRLRAILDVYLEGLVVAEQLRPDVDWGYWDCPRYDTSMAGRGLSLDTLLSRQGRYPAATTAIPTAPTSSVGTPAGSWTCSGRLPVWCSSALAASRATEQVHPRRRSLAMRRS